MRNKLLALAMLFALSFGAVVSAGATENKSFTITDGKTDLTYSVSVKGSSVSVSLDGKVVGTTYVSNIAACSVYGGILTLYSADNYNGILSVYSFDFYSDSLDSLAINADAFSNQYCFTADNKGHIYFVSEGDTSKLCIYENGNIKEVNLKHQITQLLCVDGESVIAVTTNCTYLYNGNEAVKILDSPLSVPAYYRGGGVIKDLNGTEYIYENGDLYKKAAATEPSTLSTAYITQPRLVNDIYVADIGITLSKIKKAFADFEITKIAKADGTVINSGKVGTGATVTFSTGETVTVIISGELTGEGNINSRDLKAVLNHLSEKELLTGSALLAADVDSDGKITTKDALKISLMY